jgi:D-cysteine desulfhydrase
MARLSQELGIQLSIKRDDLTGLAFGGNKTRKLELLVADAIAKGARTLVTVGAVQSNHCRQTAAAAARAGLECALVLGGDPPGEVTGNLLLDQLLGAEITWQPRSEMLETLEVTYERLEGEGRAPYLVPYGGSNPLGVTAYALAMQEAVSQGLATDRIVFASSSGGTQAGLVLGAALFGYHGTVTGISVEPPAFELKTTIKHLIGDTLDFHGLEVDVPESSIYVSDEYLGGGYAVIGDLERDAIRLFASKEGIILDPVYSGRAAGALIDMVNKGIIGQRENVVFWHTGGTPALFAYNRELTSGDQSHNLS